MSRSELRDRNSRNVRLPAGNMGWDLAWERGVAIAAPRVAADGVSRTLVAFTNVQVLEIFSAAI